MTSQSKLRFGKELNKLNINDVKLLISNKIPESQNLEYKKPTNDPQKDCDALAVVISGFLNTEGGIILYGVSEEKFKDHRIPVSIEWSSNAKERIESLLVSRIQPLAERIRIHRIPKKGSITQGVFIIEVPKSTNPPHMSNYVYYQRLNFQTKPMEHQSVYRVFQTSWIRRRENHFNTL